MDRDNIREFVAASLGGASATVAEYPLDTIKVRLQGNTRRYRTVWHCAKDIYREEGTLRGFFRGLPAPLMGSAIESAIMFVAYRSIIRTYQNLVYGYTMRNDTEPYLAVAVAGAISGIIVAQVLTPAELIKCKMQIQNTLPVKERVYKDSLDCLGAVYKRRGLRGLFCGHVAMMYREIIGCAFYFLAFQSVIRSQMVEGEKFTDVSPAVHFLGGGCAGIAFWSSVYPLDVIKTKQQIMNVDFLNLNFRQCCVRLYKTEGLRGFSRGYAVTALRAFPGNAVFIAMYEQISSLFDVFTRSQR